LEKLGQNTLFHLDKQQPLCCTIYLEQRLEEARAIDRAAEMARQEQIIKLISTELTRNTTRVVELAVKAEVQSSVLPAIEAVARTEIKLAATSQFAKGFGDSMKQVS
jgi:hypothetical protein